jgi:hypothetical protein
VVVFRCAEIGSHNRSYCLREQYIGCEQHVARQPAQSPPIQATSVCVCVCVCVGGSDQGTRERKQPDTIRGHKRCRHLTQDTKQQALGFTQSIPSVDFSSIAALRCRVVKQGLRRSVEVWLGTHARATSVGCDESGGRTSGSHTHGKPSW